jgi:hypothetical protein
LQARVPLPGRLAECPIAVVAVEHPRLAIGSAGVDSLGGLHDVPVDEDEIRPAVVLQVEEARAEADAIERRRTDPGARPDLLEETAAEIAIEALRLAVEGGHEEVRVPVALMMKQIPRHAVVGDIEVRGAVGVEVGKGDAQAAPVRRGKAEAARRLAEAALTLVVEEEAEFGIVDFGAAGALHRLAAARGDPDLAKLWVIGSEANVTRNVEIQAPVAVHVRELGARSPTGHPYPRGRRHVAEAAPLLVAEEAGLPIAGEEQIDPAVVVHVPRGAAGPEARLRQAGVRGHVAERDA